MTPGKAFFFQVSKSPFVLALKLNFGLCSKAVFSNICCGLRFLKDIFFFRGLIE